jgi:hypothetical protein
MAANETFVARGIIRPAVTALLATLAASLVVATPAGATTINTFQGTCSGALGTATWSPAPLRALPAPLELVVNFEGGSCSGTVNGEPIDGLPLLDGYIDVSGLQSCTAAEADGRGGFTLAGRGFTGTAHYRRGGITPLVYIEGDTSGYVAGLARVLVGPDELLPLAQQCGAEGISQAEVMIEAFDAPLSISSPQP